MSVENDLLSALDVTDTSTRALIGDLSEKQLAVPYDRGINPPLWELGHCAYFYEIFLLRLLDNPNPRMPGYDEIWDSFELHHKERWRKNVIPSRTITEAYYQKVIGEIRTLLQTRELTPHQQYLCLYCINHQDMHIESLIQARQTLAYPAPDTMHSRANTATRNQADQSLGDTEVPAGSYPIGLPSGPPCFEQFCFDNEKPEFNQELDSFRISKTLVSCGEFLQFVEDGGYENTDLWCFGGKHWLRESGLSHPLYWKHHDGNWHIRRFDQWQKLIPDQPILHVSFWEAEAYCRWAGRRLPTEFEWEASARGTGARRFPWGGTMDSRVVDMDGERMAQVSVDEFPEGASPFGCIQMIGTAWEWTSSQYLPYDGFCVDMYPYMSTLQFGDHKTTRGGSCATSSRLIRSTYRQAYFPSRSDVFTGFRTCAL